MHAVTLVQLDTPSNTIAMTVVVTTTLNDTTILGPPSYTLISDAALILFQWIGYSAVCQFIDVFGTATNIINIVCFIKMGFNDPINVSLLGLAVSDLFCVCTLIWSNICKTPAFLAADLPFEPIGLQYLTTGWLHTNFNRVTSWITAFITLERCLCITAPMKVKEIFTAKRVAIIIVCLYIALLFSVAPVYVANKLGMVFSPRRNKTLLGLVFSENRARLEKASFAFNNVFIPFSAFAVIIVCTTILVVKLRMQTKWRQTSANASQTDKVSRRDQRVVKMVVVISTLFIICFVPVSINFIAHMVLPGFFMDGKYKNMNLFFFGLGVILESTNSSSNIFIYYFMSSKYRAALLELLGVKKKQP